MNKTKKVNNLELISTLVSVGMVLSGIATVILTILSLQRRIEEDIIQAVGNVCVMLSITNLIIYLMKGLEEDNTEE